MPTITAHFSDIKGLISQKLAMARESVQVAVAWFTDEDLMADLIELKVNNPQISVQVIISNARENFINTANLQRLNNAHVELRVMNDGMKFLHHKFCIIDSKTVINGSYNWTYYAAARNEENIIIIAADDTYDILFTQFSAKFNYFLNPIRSTLYTHALIPEGGVDRLGSYDEEQIQLRQSFQSAVQQSMAAIMRINPDKPRAERINIELIESMIRRYGDGVQMVKRLIENSNNGQAPREGFIKLVLWGEQELSFEHLALRNEFQGLFSQPELATCRALLNAG